MSIEFSFKGVSDFMKQNADLIDQIKDTGSNLSSLADQLEANRKQADQLSASMQKIPFQVAKDQGIQKKQAQLLSDIEAMKAKIDSYKDDPASMGLYQAKLGTLYQQLADTYIQDTISKIIVFTQPEVDEIHNLLANATLDAAARQKQAAVLQAATQVGKVVLKLLLKLTA